MTRWGERVGIWQLSSLSEPAAVSAARWCHQGVSTAAAAAGAARGRLCEMEGEGKGTRGENPSICKKKINIAKATLFQ